MATTAHCIFCFEVLAATLEKRPALSLAEVEARWDEYQQSRNRKRVRDESSDEEEDEDAEPSVPAIRTTTTTTTTSDMDDEDDDDDDDDDEEEEEEDSDAPPPRHQHPPSTSLLPRALSRLRASPSSPNSSSSSTPSSRSTTSSRAALNESASTSSSSKTSLSLTTPSSSPVPAPAPTPTTTAASSNPPPPPPPPSWPLFVTWSTLSAGTGAKSLRGCIGTFDAQPLPSGLSSYALTSALHDHRFAPIPLALLPSLHVTVTLLSPFTPCAHALDWEVGVHGIKIAFGVHGRRYGACYLPDVAPEQGWSREEALESLVRKAGYVGRTRWEGLGLRVQRFAGLARGVGWGEWEAWRGWVEGRG